AADFQPSVGMRATLGTRERSPTGLLDAVGSVPSALGNVAIVVPATTIVGGAGDFVWRHRRTVRKVAMATAIGAGVAATCAAALAVPSAVACLLAARRESGATAWMFAALGLTLAVSGAAVLA